MYLSRGDHSQGMRSLGDGTSGSIQGGRRGPWCLIQLPPLERPTHTTSAYVENPAVGFAFTVLHILKELGKLVIFTQMFTVFVLHPSFLRFKVSRC